MRNHPVTIRGRESPALYDLEFTVANGISFLHDIVQERHDAPGGGYKVSYIHHLEHCTVAPGQPVRSDVIAWSPTVDALIISTSIGSCRHDHAD